ncbi:MAG: hypothetical protein A2751_04345 [Candidatus Doudnabacteria bacterium RIFCSPHIGHO2_01_FULL_46_14]|uniref:Uncharacterized protein n=1 Tax=Candidatus Doudnabacteria bacterium RIFCSPHIGHO2_01_FULL_46_14 TaxID=1817824 RepID=A0A1F5NND5_9BACT|nr:MAG: hypothetical protein A2751_04345 [Candidatus Doudnabacteria bacterium RIFCSPHIGHO2_01_FULL_46_14]
MEHFTKEEAEALVGKKFRVKDGRSFPRLSTGDEGKVTKAEKCTVGSAKGQWIIAVDFGAKWSAIDTGDPTWKPRQNRHHVFGFAKYEFSLYLEELSPTVPASGQA